MKRSARLLASGPNPGGVDVTSAMGNTGFFNPNSMWNFWSPVWGGKMNAMYDAPYYTRGMMSTGAAKVKPDEPTFMVYTEALEAAIRETAVLNQDLLWAGRQTPVSAIEVDATIVTCMGIDGGFHKYDTPVQSVQPDHKGGHTHWMSWIFVPPHKPAMCKYCGTYFKRRAGFAPKFDNNLKPETGHIPEGGCVDPCLVYVFFLFGVFVLYYIF